jgi:hypothetical protein
MLAAFDAQIRRSTRPDGSGARIEADGNVVRWAAVDGQGWSGIAWSDLDEDSADPAIAGQVSYFGGVGQQFEWKLYGYDQPADLAQRLRTHGFVPEDEETLMVAEVAALRTDISLPDGITLRPVTGEAGVALLVRVHEQVFGTEHAEWSQSLLSQVREAPEMTTMVVAMAGDQPVCSARIEFLPGVEFASLWGGGTVPGWRGRGIYRALVAYRAQLATARSYRYLQVDASADSQPILTRLGFASLACTTPYLWHPPRCATRPPCATSRHSCGGMSAGSRPGHARR